MGKNVNPDQIRWHCRRGMLELDMLLIPYFDGRYASLSENEQYDFQSLIEVEDNMLWAWLVKREPCEDKTLQRAVDSILTFQASRGDP